jgi:cobalt/nickel transport system permease protein
MHIPENYLSPQTCAVMTVAMAPVWVASVKKVRAELPKEKIPMIGVAAAFSFLFMMFNVPMPGGTTGHAVGATLIALLLGPYAACIAVTVALLIQAVLFGDGGILAFGANCFNMAFIMPFVGYTVAKAISGKSSSSPTLIDPNGGSKTRELVGAAIGSYVGINAAALCAAIEFGIQPMLFTDAAGQALYCPYGLNIAIPAMMAGHLTIFGLAEVIFTVAVLAFVRSQAPEMVAQVPESKTSSKLKALLIVLAIATPLGLIAEGTAWGEWGTDEIAATGAGYTPQGMLDGFSFDVLIPDYELGGLPGWMSAIMSAVIGVALCIIIFKVIGGVAKPSNRAS